LALSPTGKEIVDFLAQSQVRIVYSDALPIGTPVAYLPAERAIVLSKQFKDEPPIVQAVTLGHEGFHAVQDITLRSAVAIETELDAWARQSVIYGELLRAGVAPAPPGSDSHVAYGALVDAVDDGQLALFEDPIARLYRKNADDRKREVLSKMDRWAAPLGAAVMSFPYWPMFDNATAASVRLSVSIHPDTRARLKQTVQNHEEHQKWTIERMRELSSASR
jgi:hypothetical protein